MSLINLLAKQFVKEVDGHVKIIDKDSFTEMVTEFLKEAQEALFEERRDLSEKKCTIDLGPRTMFHMMRAMDKTMCVSANHEVDSYLDWGFARIDLLSDEEIDAFLTNMVRKFRKKFGNEMRSTEPYPESVYKVRCY